MADIEYLTILFETVFNTVVSAFIIDEFVHEVLDGRGKGLVVVLAVSVDIGGLVLEGGFVAVEGYFFDGFGEIREVVVAVDLEELDEFFLLERGDY
jgi:hypothetical protein